LLFAVASIYDPARKGLLGSGDGHAPGLFIFAVFFFFKTLVENFAFSQFGEKSFA
jgi:hypothetical protein